MDQIDFVIIWVNGEDSKWLELYRKYAPQSDGDKRIIRFRDWNNLRYWFRGVEKFAPWVNKIHFVTCGHYPDWLNLKASKLNFVKHSDYIRFDYLPTFNSHTIELNLHRIVGISEKFVYFNDDMFLINTVVPERFFKKDLPCDMAVLNAMSTHAIGHIILNDLNVINIRYNKKETLLKYFTKWFNLIYGKELLRTLFLLPWPHFTGFVDPHIPTSFLKTTLEEVWEISEEILDTTCVHRFRNIADVNQYLFRYWQLVNGRFTPYNTLQDSIDIPIMESNVKNIQKIITNQSKSIICLNDECISDFEYCKEQINESFNQILPEKSSFEL